MKHFDTIVIGGGPAGMEAAYVAKKRGHHVVLCDKNEELGGLMRIASVPISSKIFQRIHNTWLEN